MAVARGRVGGIPLCSAPSMTVGNEWQETKPLTYVPLDNPAKFLRAGENAGSVPDWHQQSSEHAEL